ncbi:LacI family DNA-binding transcriptional regulator [Puniceicoccus vermicola]|uniref:LacI family DNA-binding transcriptional regulator n=1 Tax=Puniceicoccus vermicola TaxID=388746 RepID=A0A7X1E5C0_9BACT|nr:LacI family DNA-binding transcriptional regulator [Puniceicoccus vermicola]MBC2602974.1 LacI family DNA-binding transcriptional regulator [Puniceicoccus vermicola]
MARLEQRIRIKDIAKSIGVSPMAVSLALRNQPGVSDKTRKRILSKATEMGYVADPAMTALSAYRTRRHSRKEFATIAILDNWPAVHDWAEFASASLLLDGARESCSKYGYQLEVFRTVKQSISDRRLSDILYSRGIRGLVIAPLCNPEKTLDVDWSKFSTITIEQPFSLPDFHYISPDYLWDISQVWRKLMERGYERIGLVLPHEAAERVQYHWAAAHMFEQQKNAPQSKRLPMLYLKDYEKKATFLKWLKQTKPDVVISKNEVIYRWLREDGYSIPNDIGYVSLTACDEPHINPAGITQNRRLMGKLLIDILHGFLMQQSSGIEAAKVGTTVQGTWTEGTTIRSL